MTPNLSDIARQVDQVFPHLLRQNTSASCFDRTARILALANDPQWQHVGKTAGESQFTPAGFQPRTVAGWDGKPYVITGVSADAIVYVPERQIVDTIGNAENDNGTPGVANWNLVPQEYNRPNNPPIPAFVTGGGGQPVPQPQPPSTPYPGDAFFTDKVGVPLHADYAEAGQLLNAGSATWFARTIWDIVKEGMSPDASLAKHRNEWRAALGLPPLS